MSSKNVGLLNALGIQEALAGQIAYLHSSIQGVQAKHTDTKGIYVLFEVTVTLQRALYDTWQDAKPISSLLLGITTIVTLLVGQATPSD